MIKLFRLITLTVAYISVSNCCTGQVVPAPTSFWGLKFGIAEGAAKATLKSKGYESFVIDSLTLYFHVSEFGGHKSNRVFLLFIDKKLAGGFVNFTIEDNNEVFPDFQGIEKDISSKYGEISIRERNIAEPYSNTPTMIEYAIKTKKAIISDTWEWGENSKDRTKILLKIEDEKNIVMMYLTEAFLQHVDRLAEKQKSEF